MLKILFYVIAHTGLHLHICSFSMHSPLQLIILFKSYVENKIEKELT
jgi:hypothetical protein